MTTRTSSDNTRGAILMMGSMAAFTFNDASLKFAAQDLPLFQVVALRGIGVTLMLAALAWWTGAFAQPIPRAERGKVALRAAAELGAFLPFVIALANMPLANITAILQALPLTVALAGAVFLREHVGWRRWIAIGIGFIGVMMIVQPGGADFNRYSMLALLAVVMVTLRDIVTRKLSSEVPSMTVAVITAAGVMMLGFVGSLFQPWQPVSGAQLGVIAAAAVFILGGYVFSVMTMRVGEIGFVAPFRYTALIWGLALGWFVFGDWPNMLTLWGSALVVATGLFTFWREQQLARERRADRL